MGRLTALLAAGALLLTAPAVAAQVPTLAVELDGSGYARAITVSLTGRSGKAVARARVVVSASMNAPGHFMSVPPRKAGSTSRGVYRARLQFPMLGRWTVLIRVDAGGFTPTTKRVTVKL
jgi:hypothetical protein